MGICIPLIFYFFLKFLELGADYVKQKKSRHGSNDCFSRRAIIMEAKVILKKKTLTDERPTSTVGMPLLQSTLVDA